MRTGIRGFQAVIGDMAFALDSLKVWNRGDHEGRFTGMLELTRVGVLGHSTGGAAAIGFCSTDPRWGGGVAMDAWMTPVPEATLARGVTAFSPPQAPRLQPEGIRRA